MNASIPEIVLRLARREIASGPIAGADLFAASQSDIARSLPAQDGSKSPANEQPAVSHDSPSDFDSSATQDPLTNPRAISPVDALSPAQSAATPPPVAAGPPFANSDDQQPNSSDKIPATFLSSTFYPPSSTSSPWPDFENGDAPQPASTIKDRGWKVANAGPGTSPSSIFNPPSSATATDLPNNQLPASTDDSSADRLSESVADQARQLEQLSRDLDSSLTRLFTTQLETLDHLRQRLDDHERLWLEQQALRRAGA